MNPSNDRYERFIEAWKQQAGRPPGLDADQASQRVRARISSGGRKRRPPLVGWALATAAVLVVLAAIFLPLRSPHRGPGGPAAVPSPPAGVAVFWLDETTPLYMNLNAQAKGEDS